MPGQYSLKPPASGRHAPDRLLSGVHLSPYQVFWWRISRRCPFAIRSTRCQAGDMKIPDLERFTGCLFGLAAGAALGTTVELKPQDSCAQARDMVGGGPFGLKPG